MRRALFLDRDGVINEDYGYVHRWEDFTFVRGAPAVIARANQAGWAVIVVTNQSGVARGYFDEAAVRALHIRMCEELREWNAAIDAIYFCPYLPGGSISAYARESADRKPRPGMLLRAAREHDLKLTMSVLIGDKPTDLEAARRAGVAGHLFEGGDLAAFAKTKVPQMWSDQASGVRSSQLT